MLSKKKKKKVACRYVLSTKQLVNNYVNRFIIGTFLVLFNRVGINLNVNRSKIILLLI